MNSAEDKKKAALAAHVKKVVDAAPPLTDEQRATLARLLLGARSVVSTPADVRIKR